MNWAWPHRRTLLLAFAALAALLVIALALGARGVSWFLGLAGIALLLWLLWQGLQAFLYKVGRRLALSYVLLGVLPIPMVLLLLWITAYLLAGAFLGHLFRDSVEQLHLEMEARARVVLTERGRTDDTPDLAFAFYRDGRRVTGDRRAPGAWPEWVAKARAAPLPRLILLDEATDQERYTEERSAEERYTLAVTTGDERRGALVFYVGDLERALTLRSDLLVDILATEETDDSAMGLSIGGREAVLKTVRPDDQRDPRLNEFLDSRALGRGWPDRSFLSWTLLTGPRLRLDDGTALAEFTPVSLRTTPRLVYQQLVAGSGEFDAYAWFGLLILAVALFWIYFVAALMAVLLIYGLSSAVNQLSAATGRLQEGDFSARIPVGRKDQVGDLQRSFNQMAENLENLVHTAAQKELLEKELSIARDLQLSLVPHDLPALEHVEIATLFQPSAAIGGDYFDILRLDDERLGVVVADVSGHGLPTGLRMAMLKAALMVLVERAERPEEILERLDTLVRSEDDSRFFVTATLALLSFEDGGLTLLNAGHPPTYLLRDGEVEEILLPGSPLGALEPRFGHAERRLQPGDGVVWLSDGLLEATDEAGEPFGYDRLRDALTGAEGETAESVKQRLLAAVAEHTGGRRPDDDLTLVVLRYRSGVV